MMVMMMMMMMMMVMVTPTIIVMMLLLLLLLLLPMMSPRGWSQLRGRGQVFGGVDWDLIAPLGVLRDGVAFCTFETENLPCYEKF